MNPYAIPALAVSIVSAILGIYVFRKDPGTRFNKAFLIFAVCLAIWTLGKFMKRAAVVSPDFGSMVENIAVIFIGPLMLRFVSIIQPATNPPILKKGYFWWLIYAVGLVFVGFLFSGNLIGETTLGLWGYDHSLEAAYGFFAVYFLGLMYASTVRLFQIFFITRTRDVLHEQSKLIFIGAVVAIGLGSATDVVLPLAGYAVVPLTSIGLLIFLALVGYAILKYKLLAIPQIRRFFRPVPEAFLKTKMRFQLENGRSYLVEEKEPSLSAGIFLDQTTHGVPGLWITSPNQKKSYKIGLRKTAVLLLTTKLLPGETLHSIDRLESLKALVENEIGLAGGTLVVAVDCFEDIVLANAFRLGIEFIEQLSKICSRHSSNLIVRVDPHKFTSRQLSIIEKVIPKI